MTLSNAFVENNKASIVKLSSLRLGYEIAVTISYLHSQDLVVGVISNSAINVRNLDENLLRQCFFFFFRIKFADTQLFSDDNFSHDDR